MTQQHNLATCPDSWGSYKVSKNTGGAICSSRVIILPGNAAVLCSSMLCACPPFRPSKIYSIAEGVEEIITDTGAFVIEIIHTPPVTFITGGCYRRVFFAAGVDRDVFFAAAGRFLSVRRRSG